MVRWITKVAGVPALLFAVTIFAFVGFTAPQAQAASTDNVKGFWTSKEKRDSLIEIYDCGEYLCGRLVSLTNPLDDSGIPVRDVFNVDESLRDRPLAGVEFLTGFSYDELTKSWTGGRIYNARDGKTYKAYMALKGDHLKVRGFVGISLFGKSDVWVEVKDTASAQ